jgi:hypothetical protein
MSCTAMAASSRPAMRVSTSMPPGRSSLTMPPEKRSTSQTVIMTARMPRPITV